MFQSSLVWNLLIVVVAAKPRNPTLEPNGVDGFHTGGRAAVNADALCKLAPQCGKGLAGDDQRRSGIAFEFTTHDTAGNLSYLHFFMPEDRHFPKISPPPGVLPAPAPTIPSSPP